MMSKADVIRKTLAGQRVLDIGGCGYGQGNPYERELAAAWHLARSRARVDLSAAADVHVDLNARPLPEVDFSQWDITTAFDVLEHLDSPLDVLQWVGTTRLLVSVPNVLSPVTRRMEQRQGEHLYNFTPFTITMLLQRGGWQVGRWHYTMGKWSLPARVINMMASFVAPFTATGIMLYCQKTNKTCC
jgi:hypothetical protein